MISLQRHFRLNAMTNHALRITNFENTQLLKFGSLANQHGLVHALTTKPWNMAPHRGPDAAHAVDRRRKLCHHLGLDFEKLTAPDQIHSHHVLRVEPQDVGRGRLGRDSAIPFVDGLICDIPGVPLLQLSADCPLILVFDPRRPAIGTAHASWRGTVARIAENLVAAMRREFHSNPADLLAAIAPCAGPARYEIGEDVRRIAKSLLPDADRFFPQSADTARRCFDLRAANVDQLQRAGLNPVHIEVADPCTITDARFYSHRREGHAAGRFALIAAISP